MEDREDSDLESLKKATLGQTEKEWLSARELLGKASSK
jgi:hypothetical protein